MKFAIFARGTAASAALVAATLALSTSAWAQTSHGSTHTMQDGTVMQGMSHDSGHGNAAMSGGGHGGGGHGAAQDIGRAGVNPTRTINITMGDNYYEPERIALAHGETVRFVITNTGSFLHEFNINTAASHAEHGPMMAMMFEMGALEPDRINHAVMNASKGTGHDMSHDAPNSVLIEPGQTREVTWTFDTMKDLEFACNIPGHYDSGMVGDFAIAH